jgi:hypothetical protein
MITPFCFDNRRDIEGFIGLAADVYILTQLTNLRGRLNSGGSVNFSM